MIGMNEALILAKREDILDEIALALEAFTDDILPAVGESTFTIEPSIPDETSNKLVLTWEWKRLQKRISKEFTLNVVSTKEDFVSSVLVDDADLRLVVDGWQKAVYLPMADAYHLDGWHIDHHYKTLFIAPDGVNI